MYIIILITYAPYFIISNSVISYLLPLWSFIPFQKRMVSMASSFIEVSSLIEVTSFLRPSRAWWVLFFLDWIIRLVLPYLYLIHWGNLIHWGQCILSDCLSFLIKLYVWFDLTHNIMFLLNMKLQLSKVDAVRSETFRR